jgi:TonB-dependent SusC/RagA subfamily outer membrane receptor
MTANWRLFLTFVSMKTTLLTITALFCVTVVNAQSPASRNARLMNPDMQPLFILNDSIISNTDLQSLNPDKIASVDVLKDSSAIAVYGERARNGVVIIHTKRRFTYLNVEEALDSFHISGDNRKLKMCIDNIQVQNPDKILIDKSDIIKIEVITDNYWKTPTEAGPIDTYLNIVTKKPIIKITP